MMTWAQLGGLMPTGIGTLAGGTGALLLFGNYAQPTCRLGTSDIPVDCLNWPISSMTMAEFIGFGLVVGAVAGWLIGLVVKHGAAQP
jgi:hypothetical protein